MVMLFYEDRMVHRVLIQNLSLGDGIGVRIFIKLSTIILKLEIDGEFSKSSGESNGIT